MHRYAESEESSIKGLSPKEGQRNCKVETKLERNELPIQERRDILAEL